MESEDIVHILIKEDGLMYVITEAIPEKPVSYLFKVRADKLRYYKALQSAKDSAIRVMNVEEVKAWIIEVHYTDDKNNDFVFRNDTVYTLPGYKFEVEEYVIHHAIEIVMLAVVSPIEVKPIRECGYVEWADQIFNTSKLLRNFHTALEFKPVDEIQNSITPEQQLKTDVSMLRLIIKELEDENKDLKARLKLEKDSAKELLSLEKQISELRDMVTELLPFTNWD